MLTLLSTSTLHWAHIYLVFICFPWKLNFRQPKIRFRRRTLMFWTSNTQTLHFKPPKSGYLNRVHTSDISISISTRSIRKQSMTSPLGLAKTKQRECFFVSPFVLLLAYAWTMILCFWRSLCRRLNFIPLFCLLFSPYAYAYAYAIVWIMRL